jgi:predicted RNA-binding protein YlxR (DUF448 family)
MCVGCRRSAPKRELVRVVVAGDRCILDPGMILPGRGAYVHPERRCVDHAVRRGGLARALRVAIGQDEVSNLLAALEGAITDR